MWVSKISDWHDSHTELSKYFIERIKQKVDPTEVISNRHKTTNGLTLVAEIIQVIKIARNRRKSLNRLVSLIEESKSKTIDSSIINDPIVVKYHPDIIAFLDRVTPSMVKESELSYLEHSFQIFYERLSTNYFINLRFEFESIDFKKDHFGRTSKKLDRLIDSLIPYLLFKEFSPQSINEIAFWYIQKGEGNISALKMLKMFQRESSSCKFLVQVPLNSEEFDFMKKLVSNDGGKITKVSLDHIKKDFFDTVPIVPDDIDLYEFSVEVKDPHNYLRNLYELTLKNFVIAKDRISLKFFNDFLETTYWRFAKAVGTTKHGYRSTKISMDPINVKNRPSTLRHTLEKCSREYGIEFKKDLSLPYLEYIEESVYYYNMALRSKSIENSLSLLWTSLESLLPFRFKETDIENVQYLVSTSLSMGVIGRQLNSFINRLIGSVYTNSIDVNTLDIPNNHKSLSTTNFSQWAKWLCVKFDKEIDPYKNMKMLSELTCSQFCKLNEIYSGQNSDFSGLKFFSHKILKSEVAIKHQLDRIYLYRNQIIHSGKFINEYSNLWSHLEWYVGKLLSFCYIRSMQDKNRDFTKEEVFLELEHDYSYIKNILKVNEKEVFITQEPNFSLFFKHSWQFF
jgi:hypothetical protein